MNMILDGKYHLIAELGQGGMAVVHLALVHGSMGFRKLAVVKLMRSNYVFDPDFVEMFLEEARLCARLSHPNIVHTYEVGVDEGKHYLAMEFLDGVSLHAAMSLARNGGPLRMQMQLRILLDVLDGLRYAHGLKDYDGKPLQIVHRDISPQNIFITFDGQVKLLDFGIAKAANSVVETAAGVIKGKLTYMAPEQARGEDIDGRADLHAVGVMLWEAIAGRRRWINVPQPAVFASLASGEPPPSPGGALLGYPEELDRIALRACAPLAAARYQTAAEFHRELEQVLRKLEPVSLRDVGTMLAESFGEERKRLQRVIEQRVHEIESGIVPEPVRDVPTMRPRSRAGTDSNSGSKPMQLPVNKEAGESTERQLQDGATPSAGGPSAGGSAGKQGNGRANGAHSASTTTASVTPITHVGRRGVPRPVIAAGLVIAVLAGMGLALRDERPKAKPSDGVELGDRRSAAHSADGAARADVHAVGDKGIPDPTHHTALGELFEPGQGPARAPTPGEVFNAENGELRGVRPDAAGRTRAQRSPLERPTLETRPGARHPTSRPSDSDETRDPGPVTPSGATPSDGERSTDGTSPLRRSTTKPKVQLDTENPWK